MNIINEIEMPATVIAATSDHTVREHYEALQTITERVARLTKRYRAESRYEILLASIARLDALIESTPELQTDLGSWPADFAVGGASYITFTAKVMALPEYIINGYGQKSIVERNHIIIRLFRTVSGDTRTIGDLYILAVLLGILSASMKSEDYPEGIVRAFKSLNMYAWSNYIDPETLATAPVIRQELVLQALKEA